MKERPTKRSARPEVDQTGATPLHYAAAAGNEQEVSRLLHEGADPNAHDEDGWTPLHFAVQGKAAAVAELLIAAGADVNATDLHGNTPLWTAVFASRGDGTLIEILRRAGADPGHANHHHVTPIALARNIANYDVAQFFSDLP